VKIPIVIRSAGPNPFARRDEPVTLGVPLPRGAATDTTAWTVRAEDGSPCAHQAEVLDRWSDGSIRWALLDFQASLPAGRQSATASLALDEPGVAAALTGLVAGEGAGSPRRVDTGALACTLSLEAPLVLAEVRRAGQLVLDQTGTGIDILAPGGERFAVRWRRLENELQGPLRAVVAVHGEATAGSGRLELVLRWDFFAGRAFVRLRLTVRNPSRSEHPGGIWELGDKGSVLLQQCTVNFKLPAPGEAVRWSVEPGGTWRNATRARIYQESSGGERWNSSNHRDRSGAVPMTFRGFRVEADGAVESGTRASPTVEVAGGGALMAAAVPSFWQNFPRAVAADTEGIALAFWPPEFPAPHELLGGEQKTHEAYLAFGGDDAPAPALAWCHDPLICHLEPDAYAAAAAAPYLVPAGRDSNRSYQALVDAAIEGSDTFDHKRERLDEYGWRHFGDIYGDHEAVFSKSPEPLVSHYNNQYDPVGGFAYQFMRSVDPRWWRHCRELAAHVVDIDIYHTDEDKAAYNHGLFWHTYHYVDAALSGHRSYPRGTNGGGPASEQNYTTGLMLHYFMTGDRAARDVAIGLARFVVDRDDGRKTIFRWLDRGDTGHATSSGSTLYHGPGRGSGNSLNAVLDGYRLSGDRAFMEKAEQIIRRCVHPSEDIGTHNLLDVERKWFYTMFLQALGKYLDFKAERGELDEGYRYGQSTLLHYARWMAEHEYPYLEKPEILEYPTETWPAQDMRKSEVFDYASRHATGEEERTRFVERARFFFDYATTTLTGMPTKTLARPVVLLLSFGFTRAYFGQHPEDRAPLAAPWAAPDDREPFVPQRVRAKKRAILLAGVMGIAALAAAAALWIRFIA